MLLVAARHQDIVPPIIPPPPPPPPPPAPLIHTCELILLCFHAATFYSSSMFIITREKSYSVGRVASSGRETGSRRPLPVPQRVREPCAERACCMPISAFFPPACAPSRTHARAAAARAVRAVRAACTAGLRRRHAHVKYSFSAHWILAADKDAFSASRRAYKWVRRRPSGPANSHGGRPRITGLAPRRAHDARNCDCRATPVITHWYDSFITASLHDAASWA